MKALEIFFYVSLIGAIALCVGATISGYYELLPIFTLNAIGSVELIKDVRKESREEIH